MTVVCDSSNPETAALTVSGTVLWWIKRIFSTPVSWKRRGSISKFWTKFSQLFRLIEFCSLSYRNIEHFGATKIFSLPQHAKASKRNYRKKVAPKLQTHPLKAETAGFWYREGFVFMRPEISVQLSSWNTAMTPQLQGMFYNKPAANCYSYRMSAKKTKKLCML